MILAVWWWERYFWHGGGGLLTPSMIILNVGQAEVLGHGINPEFACKNT